jgi:tRNA (guanosine-2'-O-)-methyltransferase
MNTKALITYLSQFVTPERLVKMETLAALRTRYITVVLEDVHQSHNASAIVRSCEAFGLQNVHCVTSKNKFDVKNTVASGASKWLTLQEYKTSQACIASLKKAGYKIVATSPHAAKTLEIINLDQKIALLFGTEQEGLTQQIIDQADELMKIPMSGFTESLNVSVSVALCVYSLSTRLRASDVAWQLSQQEQEVLLLEWLKQSIERSDLLEKHFLESKQI